MNTDIQNKFVFSFERPLPRDYFLMAWSVDFFAYYKGDLEFKIVKYRNRNCLDALKEIVPSVQAIDTDHFSVNEADLIYMRFLWS